MFFRLVYFTCDTVKAHRGQARSELVYVLSTHDYASLGAMRVQRLYKSGKPAQGVPPANG